MKPNGFKTLGILTKHLQITNVAHQCKLKKKSEFARRMLHTQFTYILVMTIPCTD